MGETGPPGERGEKGEMGLSGPTVSNEGKHVSMETVSSIKQLEVHVALCWLGYGWTERRER